MSAWQPIKTAPRDGSHVLVAVNDAAHTLINFREKRVFAAYFQTQGHDWVLEGNWANKRKPTHWMLLPEPPKAKP